MRQDMSVLVSHETAEWYTPPDIVEMVLEVFGGRIDLDPASNPFADATVKARTWYGPDRVESEYRDGLKQSWNADTVFCNPPYGKVWGKSSQAVWSSKMVSEYVRGHFEEGILLVNTTAGYVWWEELFKHHPVCLARERIRFIRPDGTQGGQAKRGQSFFYFGKNVVRFTDVFKSLGRVILPERED